MVLCKLLLCITNNPNNGFVRPKTFLQINARVYKGKKAEIKLDDINRAEFRYCVDPNKVLGDGLGFTAVQSQRWKNIVTQLLEQDHTRRISMDDQIIQTAIDQLKRDVGL